MTETPENEEPKKYQKRKPIKLSEIQERAKKEMTELAEKHGLTYERYLEVKAAMDEPDSGGFSEREATAVKAVTAEHLANAKASMQRMQDMISIQSGFKTVAQQIADTMNKSWKNPIAGLEKHKEIIEAIEKPFLPKFVNPVDPKDFIPSPSQPEDFVVPRITPLSVQIAEEMAELTAETNERNQEIAEATKSMAELMSAQNALTREQLDANSASEAFNKKVLVCTLVVGILTLLATIAAVVISLL